MNEQKKDDKMNNVEWKLLNLGYINTVEYYLKTLIGIANRLKVISFHIIIIFFLSWFYYYPL